MAPFVPRLEPPCFGSSAVNCRWIAISQMSVKSRQSVASSNENEFQYSLHTFMPPPADPLSQPTRFWLSSQSAAEATWGEALQQGCLCLHLNFHGEAELQLAEGQRAWLRPQTLCWSRGAENAARLRSRERHECLTLAYPDVWLSQHLRDAAAQMSEETRRLITPPFAATLILGRPLTGDDATWARTLMAPHLCAAARRLLETARLTDFLVRELFTAAPDEAGLMSRAERASIERVERVKALVMENLEENHTLESLARAAGCSPHYLSRTFAQVIGMPLMLWIRRAKIERAAELIAGGRCNVSEAALEVGYRSFSHFSRAFGEEKGVSPSKWVAHLSSLRGT